MTEIPTGEGNFHLLAAIDLFSRRLPGYVTGRHPDAELACQTIKIVAAALSLQILEEPVQVRVRRVVA